MDENLDVSIEKASFRMGDTLVQIRWGYFEGNDGSIKAIAFIVGPLESNFAHASGRNILAESNAIVEKERIVLGAAKLAYEWVGEQGFEQVDVAQQTWFKF